MARAVLVRIRSNGAWFVARLLPLGLLFAVVYGLTNSAVAGRAYHTLSMTWERELPFVPWAIWAYMSIFLVFWLPLLVLEREGLIWLMKRYVVVTLAAGAAFLAFPTMVTLERPPATGAFALLYALDAPYNAAPSLHVAYAVLMLGSCARVLRGWPRVAELSWLALLVISTWLTRQHQLLDIGTGALLGALSSLGSGAGAASLTGTMPSRHMRRYWPT